MRTYLLIPILAFALSGCGAVPGLQRVAGPTPCPGSIGSTNATVLSKTFHKVGEPRTDAPIALGLVREPFNKRTYSEYRRHREAMGMEVDVTFNDSVSPVPVFYRLRITDDVGMVALLNAAANQGLSEYLAKDRRYRLLHEVSFVAPPGTEQRLLGAERLHLVDDGGRLAIGGRDRSGNFLLDMSGLQVFDFGTSAICWGNDPYGRPRAALVVPGGSACPRHTEKRPDRLDNGGPHLKF